MSGSRLKGRQWRYLIATLAATTAALLLFGGAFRASSVNAAGTTVHVWLTTADGASKLTQQADITLGAVARGSVNVAVNDSLNQQTMSGGFGASFTDSSSYLLANLKAQNPTGYSTLMNQLFSSTSGIGLNMWRLPMGSSDFTAAPAHWTDDDTQGPTNNPTQNFALTSYDTGRIIPTIKDALAINPNLRIVASPWSAPAWMKNTGSLVCHVGTTDGTLLTQYNQAWADYFVKWINAYQAAGVPIWGITPQNEPGYCPTDYPGMSWTEANEAAWVHNYLKPTLAANGLNQVVLGFDHNWDNAAFPQALLAGSTAGDYTGIAWHCYDNGSDPTVMTQLHNAYPTYDQYETECSSDTNPTNIIPLSSAEVAILSAQNWARGVVYWNVALDSSNGPHLGGCTTCIPLVTVTGSTYTLANNYYQVGQLSEFVPIGSTHIASTVNAHGIVTTAFKRSDGQEVLVATNRNSASTTFEVTWNGQGSFSYTLPSRATVTFMGTVAAAPVISAVPAAGHTYEIISKVSGKPIDVAGGSTSNRAAIVQFTDDGDLSQQWRLADAGSGYFNLINVNSGLALTVPHGSNSNGTQMQQGTITGTGTSDEQWRFVSLGTGWYNVQDLTNAKGLDDRNGSIADGNPIQQWTIDPANANQQWQLVPIS
jgi:glucosylceramidase